MSKPLIVGVALFWMVVLSLALWVARSAQTEPVQPTIKIAEPGRPRASESATRLADATPIVVELDALWNAYDANEVRANQTYKGHTVELAGVIENIDVTFGQISLRLHGKNRRHSVHAGMRESMAERVGNLSKGQMVRVRCGCTGKLFSSPTLSDCSFVY